MKATMSSLLERCRQTAFSLSPAKRRLLRVIKKKSEALRMSGELLRVDLLNIKANCNDFQTMTTIAAYSDKWRPFTTWRLLEAARGDGYCGSRLTLITDSHYAIYQEMAEVAKEKEDTLSSYLSPESYALHEQESLICSYALHNPSDWDMIVHLLRGRDLWDYDALIEALAIMKSTSSTALVEGAL